MKRVAVALAATLALATAAAACTRVVDLDPPGDGGAGPDASELPPDGGTSEDGGTVLDAQAFDPDAIVHADASVAD